jgi:hypothetical protein
MGLQRVFHFYHSKVVKNGVLLRKTGLRRHSMPPLRSLALAVLLMPLASAAQAGLCDYKPSILLEKSTSALGPKIADGARQSASYYTLVHGGSAVTALGSAATSASGTLSAILMAPATMIIGGITIIGVGAFEGACYFQVDRVTDPYEVRRIIESVASVDPAISILRTNEGDAMALEEAGSRKTYLLRNLYIADGQLKHRDFGRNTNLGPILYRAIPQSAPEPSDTTDTDAQTLSPEAAPAPPDVIEMTPLVPENAPQPAPEMSR